MDCERPKVVRDIGFTCVVLHNIMRIHQVGANNVLTKANDLAALRHKQVVYVPDDNYRNPTREAKHQQDLLKDYFKQVGALDGQKDRT